MAKPLRLLFPHLWSNARPNSDFCRNNKLTACHIIKTLASKDFRFNNNVSTKLVAKSLRDTDVIISVVRHNPTFPWGHIWPLAFNCYLDNKLKDFQWRLVHKALCTGAKIHGWGMGSGICPMANCNCIETIEHIFWECPKVNSIILWLKAFCKSFNANFNLNVSFFLMGFPRINMPKVVFNRLWYVLCVSKFIIWKSRCIHVFQSHAHSSEEIQSLIINYIKQRVRADKCRLPKDEFEKVWTRKRSFVSLCGEKVYFKFV